MGKRQESRKTILCVDPRGVLSPLVKQSVGSSTTRVITAADGGAALQAIQAIGPDAVVCDLAAPTYSGADLALSLQGYGPRRSR